MPCRRSSRGGALDARAASIWAAIGETAGCGCSPTPSRGASRTSHEGRLAGVGDDGRAALWADYDADGKLDLSSRAARAASRSSTRGAEFVDMSAASVLSSRVPVRSAEWIDHDLPGRASRSSSRHGPGERALPCLAGGFFYRSDLPLGGAAGGVRSGGCLG